MNKKNSQYDILRSIANYYDIKISDYGESPQGVDWNSKEGQVNRFAQLTKVIAKDNNYSINDLGCGYGALYEYLSTYCNGFEYRGYDISKKMICRANSRFRGLDGTKFIMSDRIDSISDYSIASGIFNVRLQCSDEAWLNYMLSVLDNMYQYSEHGFSFNCLTSYSDEFMMKSYLYYADPKLIFDICMRRYSKNVTLLHDYGLYEFTIIVRM